MDYHKNKKKQSMRILHLSSWSVTPVTHGRSDCFGKIHKNHRITVFTDSSFLTSHIFFFLHLPRIFDQLCWLPVFLFCNNQSEDDPNLSWFQNELKNSRWGLFFDNLLFGLIEPEEGGIEGRCVILIVRLTELASVLWTTLHSYKNHQKKGSCQACC